MAQNPAKPEKKIAQQVGYRDSWWPGAESTRAEDARSYFLLKRMKPDAIAFSITNDGNETI